MPSQLHHNGLFQLMARLFRLYFLCSFISLSCGQLATETAYCGSYSLQSDRTLLSTAFHWVGPCGWVCVNVWGGVHHRGWKCSKISLQRYCHLHNGASLSLTRQDYFSFSFLFSVSLRLSSFTLTAGLSPASCKTYEQDNQCKGLHTSLSHHRATNAEAAGALTVTLWFREIALAHRGKGSAAMRRQRTAETNHILWQCCKQKVE